MCHLNMAQYAARRQCTCCGDGQSPQHVQHPRGVAISVRDEGHGQNPRFEHGGNIERMQRAGKDSSVPRSLTSTRTLSSQLTCFSSPLLLKAAKSNCAPTSSVSTIPAIAGSAGGLTIEGARRRQLHRVHSAHLAQRLPATAAAAAVSPPPRTLNPVHCAPAARGLNTAQRRHDGSSGIEAAPAPSRNRERLACATSQSCATNACQPPTPGRPHSLSLTADPTRSRTTPRSLPAA
jgi:hypothetical protein